MHHIYILAVYTIFGESTTAYHTGNILLHLLNVWLCYLLTRRLLDDETAGLSAALLFAVNTVGFEAIYWIAASATLMGTAFAQIAVLLTLRATTPGQALWVGAIYLACCLSYEPHVPILLVILYAWLSRKNRISAVVPIVSCIAGIAFVVADTFVFSTGSSKVSSNQIELGFHAIPHIGRFVGRLF